MARIKLKAEMGAFTLGPLACCNIAYIGITDTVDYNVGAKAVSLPVSAVWLRQSILSSFSEKVKKSVIRHGLTLGEM